MKYQPVVIIVVLLSLAQSLCCQINDLVTTQTDTTIYLIADKDPVFPGDSLLGFLSNNINYPPISRHDPTGIIYVEFVIETTGKVTYAKIIKGLQPDYDKEVLRVINNMPDWAPGYKNNKAVRTKRIIPIRIHLK